MYDKYHLPDKPKLFESFSGIGCQRMAFDRLGINYEMVGISEIDKYALQSYMAIHGDTKNYGSICDIKGKDLPQIDVFTYSFPCTDLSKAGKQKGLSDTRSGLVYEVLRILQELKVEGRLPNVLIMENVVDLVQTKFIRQFQAIQLELEQLGYTNYTQTLNAKNYGVAQNRDRVFMVSILGEYSYEFPKPTKLEKSLSDVADFKTEVPRRLLLSYYDKKGDFGERFNTQENISPCVIAKHGYAVITNNYYTKDFKKYSIKEIIEKDIPVYANSPIMAWRLMGVSDDQFHKAEKVCSNSQLYKQAGNGIVVDVFMAIVRNLI